MDVRFWATRKACESVMQKRHVDVLEMLGIIDLRAHGWFKEFRAINNLVSETVHVCLVLAGIFRRSVLRPTQLVGYVRLIHSDSCLRISTDSTLPGPTASWSDKRWGRHLPLTTRNSITSESNSHFKRCWCYLVFHHGIYHPPESPSKTRMYCTA